MFSKCLAAFGALSIATVPALAQPQAPEPAPTADAQRGGGLRGEVLGYLAFPALLVLVILAGVVFAGGDEDMPASP